MKYIDSLNLIGLGTYFASGVDCYDSILRGQLECYSCKLAGSDKKLYKSLDKELENYSTSIEESNSSSYQQHLTIPHQQHISSSFTGRSPSSYNDHQHLPISASPFGPLSSSTSRQTMIFLISTLNACFPDYDFSNSKPDQFRKEENMGMVVNSINTSLNVLPNYHAETQEKLWSSIDSEITLSKSDVYSFIPESNDPFTEEGVIWSFNYFFYNKSLKRIVFFSCRLLNKALEISKMRESNQSMDEDDDGEIFVYDEYDDYNENDNMEM